MLLPHHDAAVPADAAPGRRRLELEQVRQAGLPTSGCRGRRRLLVERRAEVLAARQGGPVVDSGQLHGCRPCAGGPLQQVIGHPIVVATC